MITPSALVCLSALAETSHTLAVCGAEYLESLLLTRMRARVREATCSTVLERELEPQPEPEARSPKPEA